MDECEDDLESDPQQQAQQDGPKLLSRPNFEVDIVKKDITLSMSCVFLTMPRAEGEYSMYSLLNSINIVNNLDIRVNLLKQMTYSGLKI